MLEEILVATISLGFGIFVGYITRDVKDKESLINVIEFRGDDNFIFWYEKGVHPVQKEALKKAFNGRMQIVEGIKHPGYMYHKRGN